MEPQNKDKIVFSFHKRYVMVILWIIAGVLLGMIIMIKYSSTSLDNSVSQAPASNIPVVASSVTPAFTVADDSKDSNMKVFTAKDLGIAFHYIKNVYHEGEDYNGPDSSAFVDDPTLSGTRVSYKDGFLEVFTKDPKQTFKDAISTTFLIDPSNTSCVVHTMSPNDDGALYGAIPGVTFMRMDAQGDVANCPTPYSSPDASATFFMFNSHPEKFFFVMGTENSLPTLRLKNGDPFFASIEFLK